MRIRQRRPAQKYQVDQLFANDPVGDLRSPQVWGVRHAVGDGKAALSGSDLRKPRFEAYKVVSQRNPRDLRRVTA
jgi:hypothetical protein